MPLPGEPLTATSDRRTWAVVLVLALLLSLLAGRVFHGFLFVHRHESPDHDRHARAAAACAETRQYPPHPLYHLALNAFSGFTDKVPRVRRVAVPLLAAAVLAKLLLSAAWARRLARRHGAPLGTAALAVLVTLLFVVGPAPPWWQFPRIYFGQLSATVWHNPTMIFAMPFCVGTLLCLDAERDGGRLLDRLLGTALLSLSVLAKPNFALVLLPALAVLVLARRFPAGVGVLYAAPALVLLGLQYANTYATTDSGVELSPLTVWEIFSDRPLAALLVSLVFPLGLVAVARGRLGARPELLFAWLLVVIAVLQFALLAEVGPRIGHGNLYWGTVPALYALFLVSAVELWRLRAAGLARLPLALAALFLALHVAGGLLLLARSLRGLDPQLT